MCTVSYVPLGSGQFILTSNRDEDPSRVTIEPGEETTIIESGSIICPKDSKAGGSWIGMSTKGKVACLLNGAFAKHKHNPPYRKSRGLILMEYFNSISAIDYHNKVDLNGIENFTLIMLENGMVYELRWDGEEKFFQLKDENEPHLWSSCTLYAEDIAAEKDERFHNWLFSCEQVPTEEEIAFFHGFNNPEGFLLDLPLVKTVSITSVKRSKSQLAMIYHDLLSHRDIEKFISINS
jgi:hypothetical protein